MEYSFLPKQMTPEEHNAFHEQRITAMNELVSHLRASIPRSWRQSRLELDARYSPATKTRAIKHRLINSITSETIEDFPQEVFYATTALHSVFSNHDQAWTKAVIELEHDENGLILNQKSSYSYGL